MWDLFCMLGFSRKRISDDILINKFHMENEMKKLQFVLTALLAVFLLAPVSQTFAAKNKAKQEVQESIKKININTASEDLLTSVPGIGPVTAKSIVKYRNENGKLTSLDNLLEIKGIGPKKLAKIKQYINI